MRFYEHRLKQKKRCNKRLELFSWFPILDEFNQYFQLNPTVFTAIPRTQSPAGRHRGLVTGQIPNGYCLKTYCTFVH
jgi:hypothetical protein